MEYYCSRRGPRNSRLKLSRKFLLAYSLDKGCPGPRTRIAPRGLRPGQLRSVPRHHHGDSVTVKTTHSTQKIAFKHVAAGSNPARRRKSSGSSAVEHVTC